MSKLSIKVVNTGDKSFKVNWDLSKVKTKGGTYRAIGGGQNECAPNDSVTIADDALFGAGANRRYQIYTEEDDNPFVTYFPSSSGYTDDPTPVINIAR